MRITINVYVSGGESERLFNLDVPPEMTIGALRISIQAETNLPDTITIHHNGVILSDDDKTMAQLGMTDGEMLMVYSQSTTNAPRRQAPQGVLHRPPAPSRPPQQQPQNQRQMHADPELIRLGLLSNPVGLQQVRSKQPELAAAVNDAQEFAKVYTGIINQAERLRNERHREVERLNADPFDAESQMRIEEMIRQERVMENLQNALEHNPEVFGRVHMLYLEVEVNKQHKVKALVDSGAQETIMSPSCAEACGLMRLIDTRFAGIARGVGTARILGKIHSAYIKIGSLHLPCSFTIMEGKSVEMLLGLDMLKRYQACIDLAKDKLIIQGEEMPFLGAADIPKELEAAVVEEPRVPAPSRTTISGSQAAAVGDSSAGPSEPQGSSSGSGTLPDTTAPMTSNAPQPPIMAPQAAAASQGPDESSIQQLISMGASRETAINALQAAEGNVDVAAGFIFF